MAVADASPDSRAVIKVTLGIYFFSLVSLLILIGLVTGSVYLTPRFFLNTLLVLSFSLAILVLPFYFIFNHEAHISGPVRSVFAFTYMAILVLGGFFLIRKVNNRPQMLPASDFSLVTHPVSPSALLVTNTSQISYYQCQADLQTKGETQTYSYFHTNYVIKDCRNKSTKLAWECFLSNQINHFQNYHRARTLAKVTPSETVSLPFSRFYLNQTIPAQSFQTDHDLEDILSYTLTCKNPVGQIVQNSFSPQ